MKKVSVLSVDVKKAFFDGDLDEDLYMRQPEGFIDPDKSDFVYRLLKAIYGLKQASRAWHKVLVRFLLELDAQSSLADNSLFVVVFKGEQILLLVYVDDILLAGNQVDVLEELSQVICEKFDARVDRSVRKFLGILIDYDEEKDI